MEYKQMMEVFSMYHTSKLNNLIHLITTPIGLIGFFSLFKTHLVAFFVVYTYLMYLDESLPYDVFCMNELIMGFNIIVASRITNKWTSFSFIVGGYVMQDFAHYISGEDTLQQHTWGNEFNASMFYKHVLYLQPLVIASQVV